MLKMKSKTLAVNHATVKGINVTTAAYDAKPAQEGVRSATTAATAFSVNASLTALEGLRTQAEKLRQQYAVKGRKATLDLLALVYAEFHAASASGELKAYMEAVDAKLKAYKIQVRKTSRDGTKLIRLVFADYTEEDLSNKQAFEYGRALTVALAKKTAPDKFATFVKDTEGGLSGIKEVDVAAAKGAPVLTAGQKALAKVNGMSTAETIVIADWGDDEEYRVAIAVRGHDDSASLKFLKLSQGKIEWLMATYEAEQKALAKPSKDDEAGDNKIMLAKLKEKVAYAETELGNVTHELDAAVKRNDPEACQLIRVKLKLLQIEATSLQSEQKKLVKRMSEMAAA